jgi:hypothetical protein
MTATTTAIRFRLLTGITEQTVRPAQAANTRTTGMKLTEAAIGWNSLTAKGKTEIEVGP